MAHTFKTFEPKDPLEKLDYLFDWAASSNNNGLTDWLAPGETIVSHTMTIPDGITLVSSDIVNGGTAILLWIEGGTEDSQYQIRCQIETSEGRTAIRTATLPVKKR